MQEQDGATGNAGAEDLVSTVGPLLTQTMSYSEASCVPPSITMILKDLDVKVMICTWSMCHFCGMRL